MEESVNYAEYTVTQKAEGKNLKKRILLIALYLLVLAVIVVVVNMTNGGAAVWVGVLFVLCIALVWFTWRLVKEEKQYEVSNAKLRINAINGSGKSTNLFDNLVSEFSLIAPMNDEYKEKFAAAGKVLDFRGNSKSPDSYFAILEKDGTTTAVCFEATNKMLKVMKFYNKNATVVTEVRR